jgi:hypothetical protein
MEVEARRLWDGAGGQRQWLDLSRVVGDAGGDVVVVTLALLPSSSKWYSITYLSPFTLG